MHIIHVAAEMAPIAKVGGLADVLLGLSRELSWKKHDVQIIIPKYDCLDLNEIQGLTLDNTPIASVYRKESYNSYVYTGWVEGLKVYFIEPHHPRCFFNRGCFYGCEDDIERYLNFCRTAVDFLLQRAICPDILHLHDWQTAALAPLIAETPFKKAPKVVFTIHNIEYQGRCSLRDVVGIGLKDLKGIRDLYDKKLANLMKGGIAAADFVTTVSPTYAWEITTPEGGRGLDKLILQHKDKLKGVLNGIDYSYWNPEIDRYLPAHFSAREMPKNSKDHATLDQKGYVKKILRDRLMLAEDHRPIVGCIARLVPQKGVELIKHALKRTLEKGGQFVLLGSSPIPHIAAEFYDLKTHYEHHPHVHLILHHQEELAHLIFGGSDLFIVPSIFEPCGLTQLIALKYGTIPIVRKTGGLADTIFDIEYSGRPFEQTNGFVFDFPDEEGLNFALDRAIDLWFNNPERWRKLMIQGMKIDYSWNRPSNSYLEIYEKIREAS